MPEKIVVSKIAFANMAVMALVHIAGAALGIYALMVLAGDALPGWQIAILDLSMPMLGLTGLVWLVAGIGFPILAFIEEPGFAALGLGLFFLVMYAMFIIPTVGVLISLFTYAGSTIFANGVTNASVLLLVSMVGIILSEGHRYATALGAFGDDQ